MDEMGIQWYNEGGKTGLGKWGIRSMHFNFFVDIWILVTQLLKIGYAFKLPKNDNKKKKITKNSHSHKEINQIYQSIHTAWDKANKEMNPSQLQHSQQLWSGQGSLMQCCWEPMQIKNCRSGLELQKHSK